MKYEALWKLRNMESNQRLWSLVKRETSQHSRWIFLSRLNLTFFLLAFSTVSSHSKVKTKQVPSNRRLISSVFASLITSAPWKYDVFLSSSSQDAGNFSYLLHKALKDEGILTLRDIQEVEGAESTASLEVGIRQSKVALVIISPDYASSPRLLEQLVQILEANRDSSSLIFPGFHLVDPSDVRKQKGTIGASFAKHEQEQDADKVKRWRASLTSMASLTGWHTESHK